MSFAINEEFLQQIETLQLIVKNNVAGAFGGNHQSKSFGSSCDFADYRDYIPGDDITKIDWNLYARFEKLYLKLFLDERQVHTKIYIDASLSMSFKDSNKAKKALELAAMVAYLSICQMDKVSIYYIKEDKIYDVVTDIVGKQSYFDHILKLNDVLFGGDCKITEAILPTKVGYGDGMSIIISDFLTDNDFEGAIDHLVSKRRDVFCIQILDDDELKPKIRGKVHFFDSEDINKTYRKDINKDIMRAYYEALEYVINRVRGFAHSRNANHLLVNANKPINEILLNDFTNMGVLK